MQHTLLEDHQDHDLNWVVGSRDSYLLVPSHLGCGQPATAPSMVQLYLGAPGLAQLFIMEAPEGHMLLLSGALSLLGGLAMLLTGHDVST
jgi:hypothetical protein